MGRRMIALTAVLLVAALVAILVGARSGGPAAGSVHGCHPLDTPSPPIQLCTRDGQPVHLVTLSDGSTSIMEDTKGKAQP
jgi:cytochrome oxidase Cu insertion factor (SCO1/SenC/PrrC family)